MFSVVNDVSIAINDVSIVRNGVSIVVNGVSCVVGGGVIIFDIIFRINLTIFADSSDFVFSMIKKNTELNILIEPGTTPPDPGT